MKNPLHKKVDKIKTGAPWEVHPFLTISAKDWYWLRDTIIKLEKENLDLKGKLK